MSMVRGSKTKNIVQKTHDPNDSKNDVLDRFSEFESKSPFVKSPFVKIFPRNETVGFDQKNM